MPRLTAAKYELSHNSGRGAVTAPLSHLELDIDTSLERLQQTFSDYELDRVSQWAAVSPRGATKWGRVGDGGLIFPSLLGRD